MAHTFDFSTWETEARGSLRVWGQSSLHNKNSLKKPNQTQPNLNHTNLFIYSPVSSVSVASLFLSRVLCECDFTLPLLSSVSVTSLFLSCPLWVWLHSSSPVSSVSVTSLFLSCVLCECDFTLPLLSSVGVASLSSHCHFFFFKET
jgi:hypothetical protein